MFIHLAVVIVLIYASVQFPKSKSFAEVTRSKYSENTVKCIRKLEELDYRLRKAELVRQFLCEGKDSNVLPNFLNFRLANSHLKYSSTYNFFKSNLLKKEIRQKKYMVRTLWKDALQNEHPSL